MYKGKRLFTLAIDLNGYATGKEEYHAQSKPYPYC